MARTVEQGFELFLDWIMPSQSERLTRVRHRSRIETSLRSQLDVSLIREIGSFTHGTGVHRHCDADLLVSIRGGRPGSSDTALSWVKGALQKSFPFTSVYVSRPAVVVAFAGGDETWEITPGFHSHRTADDDHVYDIPGAASGWLESAPQAHLDYVTEINGMDKVAGGAKKLTRLAKAWKYYNSVPISSFYLEMRAARYMQDEPNFIPVHDISRLLNKLEDDGLAAMNDPMGIAGRFYACSTDPKKRDALSKLSTAATRARKAVEAYKSGDPATAFYYLNLLFGGEFPAR
ncbi:hypothetical protein Rhe02_47180 [Rhizocola hellebori]|uniref:Nucleotidyltransferase n=1 Tax=Rhizocola hellebori TaxID=1392758 RepID=A0A8J3QBT1_9ACTN|nr:hypothetical protein [Rhizocola hellebori]GIH06651.1 hypothetical protein Rhe02_47180 [Rhizocola hellebori]